MTARRLTLIALAAAVAVLAFAAATRMTAASFTASLATGGNTVTADRLSNHFSVTPGPDATGGVDGLAVDLGLLDRPQTVTGVFTVTNVGAAAATATLAFVGPQVAVPAFASSGTASATLAPGASSSVSLTTSAAKADEVAGTLRLRLGSSTWLYRDYSVAFEAAPAAPGSLTATPKPAADIELSWAASETTDGLAGYDVYRSTGGSWTKRNTTPVTGTTWLDTSSSNGTQYSYRVRTVSAGGLQSIDSETATARADSSAPTRPSAVALANGGGTGSAYLNGTNSGSVSVQVTLGSSSVSTDLLTVTLSRSGVSVTATAPATQGAGTVTLSGIDASALPDGAVTISATAADAAGNVSSARTRTSTKDTVAPGAPTASYTDRTGSQTDRITGAAEGSSTITATRTVPSAAGPYTTTAASGGTYTVTVAAQAGSPGSPVIVTYLVTATDAAGNVSAETVLTYAVTR